MLLVRRPLALTAVLLALSAQPSLAHTHSSRHAARHYHALARASGGAWQQPNNGWQGSSWRQQDAWQQQNSWQRQNSWQQQNSRQQQNFASNPGFGGYAENYPARDSRRGRRYEQGWNSPSAEQNFGDRSQLQGSQLQGMA